MLYQDKKGNIYPSLFHRILGIASPHLTFHFGGVIKKKRFPKSELYVEVGKLVRAGFEEGLKSGGRND